MSDKQEPDRQFAPGGNSPPQEPQPDLSRQSPEKPKLQLGAKDAHGNIKAEIYHDSPHSDYVVYEDKFGNLCIDGEGDKRLTKDVEASLAIAQYGEFNRCLTPAERRIFNPRAAQAYKVLLDGDYTTGAKIFSSTIRGVEQSLKRRSRRAYLAGGLGVTAAILVSLGALYKFSHLSPTGLRIWLSLLLASMGGFMSMSMGIKNISVDHRERYSANAFVGCLRIVIALISGTVAYLLVESKIVFAFLGDQTDGYGFLVVPFMAGFVESFVPNVLKQMDTKHSGNANADPTRVTPPDSGAEGST